MSEVDCFDFKMQSDGSIQAETILKWLQQEMGYQNPPSVDFLRRICRGNMISVWNFLLERVKSEKTNEMIRRNFVIHGTKIPSTVIPIDESLKVKHGAAESKKEVLEDRSKTHKNDREVFRRDGTLVKSTPAREKRSRSSARTLIKDLPEKERQVDRVLQSEGAEDSREMAMRDRDVAMAEVGRLRVVIDRLVKETKSRMTDVTMEEGERQRVLDERSNSRCCWNLACNGLSRRLVFLLSTHVDFNHMWSMLERHKEGKMYALI